MSLYDACIPQLAKVCRNLSSWLDEAVTFAQDRGFDADLLLEERLYPDMFPLRRQIQAVADGAKLTGARLAGIEAPVHADDETTIAQLQARLEEVATYLEGIDPAAFDGKRILSPSFLRGGTVTGTDYANEFGLPNTYFHATMAYALLRKVGVKLGKRAFLGSMRVEPPQA